MPASLSFAKLVASPTETAWSQVYHAGNLFALVSLASEKPETELNALGKEMFNILESNFFSLEKKTLTTISEIIEESLKDIPPSVTLSACIAFSKDAVLYLFLVGEGMIIMKRGEKIGVILSQKDQDGSRRPSTSSGFLNHEDVLLMQTGAFTRLLSYDVVKEALERHLPNEITERLSSEVVELPGDASAVTLMYQGASSPNALTPAQEMRQQEKNTSPLHDEIEPKEPPKEEVEAEPEKKALHDDEIHEKEDIHAEHDAADLDAALRDEEEKKKSDKEMRAWEDEHPTQQEEKNEPDDTESPETSPVTVTRRAPSFKLPPRRVLIGAVALLLLGVLVFSIFFTKKQTGDSETQAVYEQTLTEATTKYEEAEGLKNLNAALAQEDYKEAARILKAGLAKIPKGSEEEKELLSLLEKVEHNIVAAEGQTVTAKPVDLSESPLLTLAVEESSSFVAEDGGKRYTLTGTAVREDEEDVIENDDDWDEVTGLSVYNGNIYVLDKEEGILKFTAASEGYGKSSYFSDPPSLTEATSMGIDGSVYVLFRNGTVKKYTRGTAESFTLSGLPSPLKSPKQLVTTQDMDSIYILDSGNSRVVQISKDGAFQKAWKAEVLATADLIDVQEEEKKLYILKGKNLFMIPME